MPIRWTLGLIVMVAPPTIRAQDAAPAATIEPAARALLEAVGAKYKGLDGYSDQGEFVYRFKVNGEAKDQRAKKSLTYARPDKLNVIVEGVQFVTDGQSSTSLMGDKYLTGGAPSLLSPEELASNPSAVYYFGGATGMPSMAVLRLLTADDPTVALLEGVAELKLEADRTVDGKPLKSLSFKPVVGPLVRLMVDPATMLLARVEIQPSAAELPPGMTIEEMSWNSGPISTEAPPAGAFVFKPAEAQTKVETVAELISQGDEGVPGADLIGKPAPEFKFQLVKSDDAVAPMTAAHLKRKVVQIDFWATWCGPCIREMPEIAKLTESYAKGPNADKVRILALSIDSGELEKLDEVRQLVATTLRELKLEPRVAPSGLLGLDPENEMMAAFGVEAIPMQVLIDAKGIVRKVHVGQPGIGPTLAREIEELLAEQP